MTASPQIRDTSVSGGQGTDNAEVGGSIPPSPTVKDLVRVGSRRMTATVAIEARWGSRQRVRQLRPWPPLPLRRRSPGRPPTCPPGAGPVGYGLPPSAAP